MRSNSRWSALPRLYGKLIYRGQTVPWPVEARTQLAYGLLILLETKSRKASRDVRLCPCDGHVVNRDRTGDNDSEQEHRLTPFHLHC